MNVDRDIFGEVYPPSQRGRDCQLGRRMCDRWWSKQKARGRIRRQRRSPAPLNSFLGSSLAESNKRSPASYEAEGMPFISTSPGDELGEGTRRLPVSNPNANQRIQKSGIEAFHPCFTAFPGAFPTTHLQFDMEMHPKRIDAPAAIILARIIRPCCATNFGQEFQQFEP